MEHMRMDPKHQFAAQYMLSRAAAERRERDTILAAAVAGGSNLLQIGQNSRGASPSAHSDTSSCNGRLSSPPPDMHQNDNAMSESASDNNNNTNGATSGGGGVGSYNGKLSVNDVLRSQTSGQLHQQYQQVVAAAAAGIAAQNQNNCNGLGSPGNPASQAAQAVVNLAAAMRQNQPMQNGNQQSSPSAYHHNNQGMSSSHHHHQAEVLLRSQAEAALRLAVSQAAAVVASNGNVNDGNANHQNNQFRHHNGAPYHHQGGASHLQSQFTPDLSEALRLQEQRLEQALRLHGSELGLHHQHNQQP
jgi:zinc finger protein 362/384